LLDTRVFLFAPQDFHNLCLMTRTLEAFGAAECFIFDPHRLVRERYGKVRSREMRAMSGGAFEKISWRPIADPAVFLADYSGRVVATVADAGAIPLDRHRFQKDDLVVFGPESSGLPPEVVERSSVRLTIPLVGETRSLNLAVALGVVLFESRRQCLVE
jgi:tRNA G18 (ribose-2'-O)-methylase SpoU